ncbi:hypothetical protein [Nocardiopsis valliformis]|uniref:hypothetical protein n=1 Tax=Nocardiopsis valliformis TaxID=239974 RepID=UPI0003469B55|nr:hypothetical protein [Nocardiopsis valliformis]
MAIEFKTHILLSLGSFVFAMAWLRPETVGAPNPRYGYPCRFRRFDWLSLPAIALLTVGAVYEAFSLVYLVPRMLLG